MSFVNLSSLQMRVMEMENTAVTAFTNTTVAVIKTFDLTSFRGVVLSAIIFEIDISAKSDGSTWTINGDVTITFSDDATEAFAITELSITATVTRYFSYPVFQMPFGSRYANPTMTGTFNAAFNQNINDITMTKNANGLSLKTVDLRAYRTAGTGTMTSNMQNAYLVGWRLS